MSEQYWTNHLGHLIPESRVKPLDKLSDQLVKKLVKRAEDLAELIAKFEADSHSDIAQFVELSGESYGVHRGGDKGNVTLMTYDGRYKVHRAISERIELDERLLAAKALIEECLAEWTADASQELRSIVSAVFAPGRGGTVSVAAVLSLRRLGITDPRWLRAMEAISDSIRVVGSKSSVRVYRMDEQSKYQPIAVRS